MDRVKAIKVLKPLVDSYVDYANISMKEEDDNIVEALEMAIEALDVPDTNVGDMISRRQAIDAVSEYATIWMSYTDDMSASDIAQEAINSAKDTMIRILKNQPTVQPEPHWIPCSERLPENDNEVLITVWDAEDDYVEVYKGFYQGHEWWTQWCHGCSKIKDEPCGENIVIAWRPLPASYKGE